MTVLSRVQLNPEILTANETYVTDLVTRVEQFIVAHCHLSQFPSLAAGYSKSAATPATDLTALATNEVVVNVNGSGGYTVELTLASCTSGAATAAELQTQIRAIDIVGFEEVTVVYGTFYTITSGRFGVDSSIAITFTDGYEDVARALKLGPAYGGTELPGSAVDEVLESAAVSQVEIMYRKLGVEGFKSGAVPWGVSFTMHDMDPNVMDTLNNKRGLWP